MRADKSAAGGDGVEAIVLGSAQDAGVPQMMCGCAHCVAARDARRTASSVALVQGQDVVLLDASPDIQSQWATLAPGSHLAGIALTHAHAGHVAGLATLGKEGPQVACPLIATPRMHQHIQATSILADGCHGMDPVEVRPGDAIDAPLPMRFHGIAHRAERSDTIAIEAVGPDRRFLYLPDTDAFDAHVESAVWGLEQGDVLLFDATFWSADEVAHRDVDAIPHPFVQDALPQLEALAARGVRVVLGHLNHTNPLCDPASAASRAVRAAGLHVAHDGMRFPL